MAVNGTRLKNTDTCRPPALAGTLGPHATRPNHGGKKRKRWRGGQRGPVRAGGRRAAASAVQRDRTPRHDTRVGAIAVDPEGPDLGGTDRVAPGRTRCHESHDVGPPFIAAHDDAKHVFCRPKYLAFLRVAGHYLLGDRKLYLTPIESTPDYCGADLENNWT